MIKSKTRIICGDCMEVIKKIPDNSIDLIINDPPYGLRKHEWDKIDNYLDWSMLWIKEAERVLKDTGSFYFFQFMVEFLGYIMVNIDKRTKLLLKSLIVWNKRFPGCVDWNYWNAKIAVRAKRRYIKMAEYILFYTFQDETGLNRIFNNPDCFKSLKDYFLHEKQKSGLINKDINTILGTATSGSGMAGHYFKGDLVQWTLPTEVMYKKLQSTGFFQRSYKSLRQEYESLRQEYESLRQEYESLRYTFNNQKTHHSVWNYSYVKNPDHPTQKPVELIENIIKHSSNEGDIVLDMFAGSGSTGVAAKRLGRHFIGIEKEKKFCQIAKERLLVLEGELT